jgi:hypothetical protein
VPGWYCKIKVVQGKKYSARIAVSWVRRPESLSCTGEYI